VALCDIVTHMTDEIVGGSTLWEKVLRRHASKAERIAARRWIRAVARYPELAERSAPMGRVRVGGHRHGGRGVGRLRRWIESHVRRWRLATIGALRAECRTVAGRDLWGALARAAFEEALARGVQDGTLVGSQDDDIVSSKECAERFWQTPPMELE
jgi:hypothetical protein